MDLSLVVPCYNEEPHLVASVAAVREVLDSSRYSYEIVFVDDCSGDGTRDVIRRLCRAHRNCRYIFHETNRGRGAAFKAGFRDSRGRVTGFVDIDLEVGAHYIVPLVNQILKHGYDVAIGHRHYRLQQTGALFRHVLSLGYRALCGALLGTGFGDTESGCKFFSRSSAGTVVLASNSDNWFWDTEVMSRAALAGLKIFELPVLFLRRWDKQSTVRAVPDSLRYLRELWAFRSKVGLGLSGKSPIYWTATGYDFCMRILLGRHYDKTYEDVAARIPPGATVNEACAGTGRLYRLWLRERRCDYLGLEANGHFVMSMRRRDVPAKLADVRTGPLPGADYLVMVSSFYHFRQAEGEMLSRLRAAARCEVIISEPVENLSKMRFGWLARLMNGLTNPGIGDYTYRYDIESFRRFAERHGASGFYYSRGDRSAIAVFDPDTPSS